MFCSQCGNESPSGARFCSACGKSLGGTGTSFGTQYKIGQITWDLIKYRSINASDVRFILLGAGRDVLAQTSSFKFMNLNSRYQRDFDRTSESSGPHMTLLQNLLSSGWEQMQPMPDDSWYATRLRKILLTGQRL